jgi:UDP-N-acetylmuramoyl-L-alanyl-D-glutamate--2,6-diaminopimelate ligase
MQSRSLLDVLRREDLLVAAPADLPALTGVGVDSRSVSPGMLYVAMRGSQTDGHRYIAEAVRRGAAAVVVEQSQPAGVPEVVVRDGRRAALALGAAWYDYPARRLTLLGVTGTNGKTTTTGLLKHLYNDRGTAGSLGTLGAFDGRDEPIVSTAGSLTTPGSVDLQATLAELVARGTTHVAMEASASMVSSSQRASLPTSPATISTITAPWIHTLRPNSS